MEQADEAQQTGYGILPSLGKSVKCIDIYINGKLKEANVGLTKKQFLVLKSLSLRGPLQQTELAFITERDKASLTRFINTLEKKNLVARIPSSSDKRVNLIHLTKHGECTFNDTVPIFKELVLSIQKDIPQKDLDITQKVLTRIKENINISKTSCTDN